MSTATRRFRKWVRGSLWIGAIGMVALHGAGCLIMPGEARLKGIADPATLVTNGFTIRYHARTNADALWNVVFIHGTPASAAIWRSQFTDPFPRANLVAYDRPGFGASKPSARDPHLEEQVAALSHLVASLPQRATILVGHSYGGPVALMTAIRQPELVAGVVLIGGSVDPAQERPLWIQYPLHTAAVSWALPSWLRQCNRELMTLKADLIALEKELPRLRTPVVMLHGGLDRQVPVANVAYLRQKLDGLGKRDLFQQLVFADYTHFIPWEHPDAVAEAIGMAMERAREVPDH